MTLRNFAIASSVVLLSCTAGLTEYVDEPDPSAHIMDLLKCPSTIADIHKRIDRLEPYMTACIEECAPAKAADVGDLAIATAWAKINYDVKPDDEGLRDRLCKSVNNIQLRLEAP